VPYVLVASDNFNRAALGAGWTQTNNTNAGDCSIDTSIQLTGQFSLQPTRQLASIIWVGAGTFTNNQSSSIQLVNFNNGANVCYGVTVRCTGTTSATRNCVEFYITQDNTVGAPLTTVFHKLNNGTSTLFVSTTVTWNTNDTASLDAVGSTFTCYKNGVALGGSFTQVDTGFPTGVPGASATAAAFADNWQGFNIVSAGGKLPFMFPLARDERGEDDWGAEQGNPFSLQRFGRLRRW
jgi:hypothetical protein